MTLYVDSSAFLKLCVEEPETASCRELLASDPRWVSGRHTLVEVRRNLARHLEGRMLSKMRRAFERHWRRTEVVELDKTLCADAATVVERTQVRTLDALHLAAARRFGSRGLSLVTYDRRQATAARTLGLAVLGAE